MTRRLRTEEKALWDKVVKSVRPLHPRSLEVPPAEEIPAPPPVPTRRSVPKVALRPQVPKPVATPGTTLDASWDRRLARGAVQPDFFLDLHGYSLATAWHLLDLRLEQAIAQRARVMLLVTGKPPKGEPPVARGRIRAAVGDWLETSRHAGAIAAVRNAHPRHGGMGALYIILRRRDR